LNLKRSPIVSVCIYSILAVGSVVMLYPFMFMVLASLGSNTDYYSTVIVPIPTQLHFMQYITVFASPTVYLLYWNTFIRCSWYIFVNCLVALVCGYVFSKLRFRGKNTIFIILLATMMIPGQVTLIPNYLILARWPLAGGNNIMGAGGHGLLDSWGALLILNVSLVYFIFLMKQSMESIPYEYEEAARVDGANVMHVIFRIYAPMVKPVLAAIVIMTFIGVWNDYLYPLVVISTPSKNVIATGIASLMLKATASGQIPNYPEIFSLSTIAVFPPIFVYLFLQKYFIEAFTATGIKG